MINKIIEKIKSFAKSRNSDIERYLATKPITSPQDLEHYIRKYERDSYDPTKFWGRAL